MPELFANNVRIVLDSALDSDSTDVYLPSNSTAGLKSSFDTGDFQRATLEHPDHPALPPEIVFITFHEPAYPMVRLLRGQEGTTPQEWPVGTQLTCRVTAGMLASFAVEGEDAAFTRTRVENVDSSPREILQLSNFYVEGDTGLSSRPWPKYSAMAQEMIYNPRAFEVVLQSGIYDFGVPPIHSPSEVYSPGAVVRPQPPDGHQYTLQMGSSSARQTTGAVAFGAFAIIYDGSSTPIGGWVETTDPVDIVEQFSYYDGEGLILSECGVVIIGTEATSAPTFSIGVPGDPAAFANAVAATLYATGPAKPGLLRVVTPITHQQVTRGMTFKVVTPADAPCRGYFYCKGILVGSS